jgi:lysine-N-methylase
LSHNVAVPANYSDRFRCIGSECEDTCCKDWSIPISEADIEKLNTLPVGPLRTLVESSIAVKPQAQAAAGSPPVPASPFAIIRLDATQHCPMLSHDRLCRVHAEHGSEPLPYACATYPRIVHSIGGLQEAALTLSCPEAARLVLLDPDLLRQGTARASATPAQAQPNLEVESGAKPSGARLQEWFWPIRKTVLALVLNRAYPLWQRLFLLSIFCRRLDSIAAGEIDRSVLDFLRDFEFTVASGELRPAMETLPVDGESQLDVVLRLAGMLLNRSLRGPRFAECVQAFTTGIGNGPNATLESLTRQYEWVHDHYYAPFFQRHPYILENYLVNTIVRCQFPFGREGMKPDAALNLTREFGKLIAQFTLMKGLLIGVAGFHGELFAKERVIHTVQAASRHFEHHPEFLNMAYALLVESQMDGARGVSILLRNAARWLPVTAQATSRISAVQEIPN